MGLFSSVVGAVGGIAGSLLGNKGSSDVASDNREFQEEMSRTAVQRRVEDMKKAGLNPLLSVSNASSGASTPVGSQATVDYSSAVQGISNAVQAQINRDVADAEIRKKDSETAKNYDDMVTSEINRLNTQMDTELKNVGIKSEKLKQDLLSAQTDKERANILKIFSEKNNLDQDTRKKLVDTATQIFNLETMKKDPSFTSQGLSERHYKNVAPNNAYQAVYIGGREVGRRLADKSVKGVSNAKSYINPRKSDSKFTNSVLDFWNRW